MSPPGKAEAIEAAAAAWFARRMSSEWDAAADGKLQAWLSESTAHRIALLRLEAAWEKAEQLKTLGAGVPAGQVPARAASGLSRGALEDGPSETEAFISAVGPNAVRRVRLPWTLGVASLVAAVVVALAVWYRPAARWSTYSTPVGAIAPVALADGSRITLDSDSLIQVVLERNRRMIRLDRGGALFEVAKDASRPLVVEVGDRRVTAVGTEFMVRRDAEGLQVFVKDGRVRVGDGRGAGGPHAAELEAGEEASTRGDRIVVERVGVEEVERNLAWQEGYLEFRETPLSQVVAEFNRYRVQKIDIEDPTINSIRIGGRFRCTDADSFLTLLQQGFPVSVIRDGGRVGLRRR